ncbi:SMI1/KNR4 family protein [Hymenobacter lapidiphilus]|uniref:SMI1/KNR4 family protein n=1 Tax=Hymenobacter sp. CCM 8763 TaxID=2303334 RepID=UPI000E341010|nr:SMI1/KNR4 family protein [Hymenobacter sp. CCM 8763]RFP63462.1 SMI1/KNR4 family protein [Hymenobacter sp. CCM 8763]
MNTAEKYILGLKKAYHDNGADEIWNHFEKVKEGVNSKIITQLKNLYPEIPKALVDLLEYVDGTYWRAYQDEEIALYFLGSDIEGYPYYLLSSEQMINNKNQAAEYYSDYIEREYEEVDIDEKITDRTDELKWLHFSDCMNNGGTSQLFIDFSPSESGKQGQVVRFLHDPDKFSVIAESFEEYLQKLMDNEYEFINEDTLD